MWSPEYAAWTRMRNKCYNRNNLDYLYYGGANPPVIVSFDSFEQFLVEVGPRPGPNYSLDRWPNKTGNYESGNIRWATKSQQSRNLKSNAYLTYNNVTKLVIEWAEECDINVYTIRTRIRAGWSTERILTQPVLVMRKTIKHGARINGKSTDEYRAWNAMCNRCNNSNSIAYKYYGNIGVIVAHEWLDFSQFLKDVGLRPGHNYSLDRWPNKTGNYEPGNIRWATKSQQSRNLKSNVYLTYNNVTKLVVEWAIETGISVGTIRTRKYRGWSDERTLTQPVVKGMRG